MPLPFTQPREASRRARARAFTLLELVLVMVVVSIVAAMIAPNLSIFGRGRQADDAAQQLVAVAHWAHDQAVARGEVYRLNVDNSCRTYWLTVQRDSTFENLGEEFGRVFSFPDNMNVECDFKSQSDGRYIEFQPSGRNDTANFRLTAPSGTVIQVGCQSPTDGFQVFPEGTQVQWGSQPAGAQR